MNLVQLRYFREVIAHQSFTKAAKALNVAQPAVSRQIRLLEEDLGLRLLVRHAGGAHATTAGEQLYYRTEAILQMLEETRSELYANAVAPAGPLRIGFVPSVANVLVPALVQSYRAQFPKVFIQLFEGYSNLLRSWILADRIDLAILTGQARDPAFVHQRLYEEDVWAFHNIQSDAGIRAYAVELLSGKPLIQTGQENSLRKLLEQTAAQSGTKLDIVVEAESLFVLKRLVVDGVGYHVSPYSSFADMLEEKRCFGGPVEDLSITRCIAFRSGKPINRATAELIDMAHGEVARIARSGASWMRPAKD